MNAHIPVILLAEDNPKDVDLTSRALAASNLANRLVVTKDGVEALEYLRGEGAFAAREQEQPAVVLLDIKMPRKDGLEVLRVIREDPKLKRLPVVILTSSREEQDLISRLRSRRQRLRCQAGRLRGVHQGRKGSRGLLGAHQRAAARDRVVT